MKKQQPRERKWFLRDRLRYWHRDGNVLRTAASRGRYYAETRRWIINGETHSRVVGTWWPAC